MGDVRVNRRTVVTRKSGGVSTALGDVCKVPEGGGPASLAVASSADGLRGAVLVEAAS